MRTQTTIALWLGAWLLMFTSLLTTSAHAAPSQASCPAVQADPKAAYFEPAQSLLRDPTGKMGLNEVADPQQAAKFVPVDGQL